jgi:hypothetical protein
MKPNKKLLAREWLIFLSLFIIGFFSTPLIYFNGFYYGYHYYSRFYVFIAHLHSPYYWLETWLAVLAPYLAVQIVRSVIWSIRSIK